MPKDSMSRQFQDKASDAVDAFAVDLEERLKKEERPALLKLACLLILLHQIELMIPVLTEGPDQRQFYAYVSEELTKLFIRENWLNAPRYTDLDLSSSDDGKSPEKDSGKKPEKKADKSDKKGDESEKPGISGRRSGRSDRNK